MKRALSLLIPLLCICLSLYGCQSGETGQEIETEAETDADLEEASVAVDDTDYAMSDGTTIVPETLVDTGEVTVRVLGISDTPEAPVIKMAFSKGNSMYLDMDIDYIIINGWQVDGKLFPPDDAAILSFHNYSRDHKNFQGEIRIQTGALTGSGILTEVQQIEIGYAVAGDTRYGEIASGVYSADTSSDAGESTYSCDGPVILEKDGVSVQLDSFEWGTDSTGNSYAALLLYTENISENRVRIGISDSGKYDGTKPAAEETGEESRHVISRSENDGRVLDSVTLNLDTDVCAGARRLMEVTSSIPGKTVTFSEGDVLSFTLNIYDYDYTGDDDEESGLLISKDVEINMEGEIVEG